MTTQPSHGNSKDLELITSIFAPMLYLENVLATEPQIVAVEGATLERKKREVESVGAEQEGKSWSVQETKGNIKGVGVMVSGLGAYAKLKGSMEFETRTLETSSTYKEMKKTYGFSAGISSFWSWIGIGANASHHKEELTRVFNELSKSEKTKGKINVDLFVTGVYPNVPVSASAYILAFQVSSKTESDIKFPVISSGAPNQDIGAKDSNGQSLPVKDNNSTIDI